MNPTYAFPEPREQTRPGPHYRELRFLTTRTLQFIDITDEVHRLVSESEVQDGTVLVQSLHTTAAVLVNEHEPLLLRDLATALERIAPQGIPYRHDDFSIRTVNMTPDEKPNGHAHCKALFLPTSVTLTVRDGNLRIGRWQRVFLLELDRSRERTVVMSLSRW